MISIVGIIFYINTFQKTVEVTYKVPTTSTTLFQVGAVSGDYLCYQWLGSENFNECILGTELETISKFDFPLNNIIIWKENIFAIQGNGIIHKINQNYDSTIFLNISEKVGWKDGTETGLFSIAFSPSEKSAIVNYSNKKDALIV